MGKLDYIWSVRLTRERERGACRSSVSTFSYHLNPSESPSRPHGHSPLQKRRLVISAHTGTHTCTRTQLQLSECKLQKVQLHRNRFKNMNLPPDLLSWIEHKATSHPSWAKSCAETEGNLIPKGDWENARVLSLRKASRRNFRLSWVWTLAPMHPANTRPAGLAAYFTCLKILISSSTPQAC